VITEFATWGGSQGIVSGPGGLWFTASDTIGFASLKPAAAKHNRLKNTPSECDRVE
jgi:hypothetical protein